MVEILTNDRVCLGAHFQRPSDEQCQKIHWASLEVKVEAILSKHKPEPLPQDVAQAVRAIVERAKTRYA